MWRRALRRSAVATKASDEQALYGAADNRPIGRAPAAPHAVGIAAIIVAQRGRRDRARGGLTPAPDSFELILRKTAISSTVKELVAGSGIRFEDRGTHALKGIPDDWRLFSPIEERDPLRRG